MVFVPAENPSPASIVHCFRFMSIVHLCMVLPEVFHLQGGHGRCSSRISIAFMSSRFFPPQSPQNLRNAFRRPLNESLLLPLCSFSLLQYRLLRSRSPLIIYSASTTSLYNTSREYFSSTTLLVVQWLTERAVWKPCLLNHTVTAQLHLKLPTTLLLPVAMVTVVIRRVRRSGRHQSPPTLTRPRRLRSPNMGLLSFPKSVTKTELLIHSLS